MRLVGLAAVLATLAIVARAEEFEIVDCKSTQGPVEIHVVREWSPLGAARFLELVDDGYFSDLALFRCVRNFLCQFGYKDLAFNRWSGKTFPDDDKSKAPSRFKRGYVRNSSPKLARARTHTHTHNATGADARKMQISFAGNGVASRSSHLFVRHVLLTRGR